MSYEKIDDIVKYWGTSRAGIHKILLELVKFIKRIEEKIDDLKNEK